MPVTWKINNLVTTGKDPFLSTKAFSGTWQTLWRGTIVPAAPGVAEQLGDTVFRLLKIGKQHISNLHCQT